MDDVTTWLDAYRAAWVDRDPDAAAALFTDDARYAVTPHEPPHVGPDGVRAYWAQVTADQTHVDVRYGTPVTDGHRTAVEWWATLTTGDGDATLAGEFLLVFAADGRCRELREYWFVTPGHLEPPDGWGT